MIINNPWDIGTPDTHSTIGELYKLITFHFGLEMYSFNNGGEGDIVLECSKGSLLCVSHFYFLIN